MAIEDTLDYWSNWLQTKVITYSLVTLHWITLGWEYASGFTWRTIRAIRDAHIQELWYFRERNECPWPLKETQAVDRFSTEAMWCPRLQRMYFRETYRPGDQNTTHSFNDVVTAELYNADKIIQYDLSSFFHTFSWRSVRAAPSLYEVVLLYCLSHNIFMSKSQLEGFTLEVMTAEGETIRQRFDSTRSCVPFESWESYQEDEGVADDSSVELEQVD